MPSSIQQPEAAAGEEAQPIGEMAAEREADIGTHTTPLGLLSHSFVAFVVQLEVLLKKK